MSAGALPRNWTRTDLRSSPPAEVSTPRTCRPRSSESVAITRATRIPRLRFAKSKMPVTGSMSWSTPHGVVTSGWWKRANSLGQRGLIVNISYRAAQRHLGNTVYGIAKAATDKMTFDMAHELREYGVSVISLYPGLVRAEIPGSSRDPEPLPWPRKLRRTSGLSTLAASSQSR